MGDDRRIHLTRHARDRIEQRVAPYAEDAESRVVSEVDAVIERAGLKRRPPKWSGMNYSSRARTTFARIRVGSEDLCVVVKKAARRRSFAIVTVVSRRQHDCRGGGGGDA